MENETRYDIWVNHEQSVVSFYPVEGFEQVTFFSVSELQAYLQILLARGFLFQ